MKRRNFISASIVVSTSSILTTNVIAQGDNPQKPFIVKAGKSRFDDLNTGGTLKVSGKDTNGEFCVFEAKTETGPMAGPPLHMHKYQDEVFQIIEGDFLFQVGNEKIKASAGDFVFGPRNIPHTYYQLSKRSHMIFSFNPAGKMENIMKEMTKFMPHDPESFAKACASNDVPFVEPPMKGE